MEKRRNGSEAQVAVNPSAFDRLEAQARRLYRMAVTMLGIVAVVPPLVFFVLALGSLRADAERHAEHVAQRIASSVHGSDYDLGYLASVIREEMAFGNLASLRLVGAGGEDILHVGSRPSWFGGAEVAVRLPGPAAPIRELRVAPNDRALFGQAARVVGVHVVVAAVLAAIVFRVSLRALRQAIAEVQRTQAQLLHSDKLSSIGEMYASLTHEINNPLGVILARAKFLLGVAAERRLSPDVVGDLEVIDRHGTRIAEIIRSLLAFARKAEFALAATDVNDVIADVVALVERPFARQGIRVEALLDRSLPRIRASGDHLQQVFLNLLNNARDAMPKGGTVTVRTYPKGTDLVAEVRDTGTGIAPAVQARLFEPFFTTKDVGKGTGLGLAVSYGIVRAHGGEITVDSRPGDGATFRVVLPAGGAGR